MPAIIPVTQRIAEMLKLPDTTHPETPPLHIFLDKLQTRPMPFDGFEVQSFLPALITIILHALSMPEKCYVPLQALYVPAICRYEYTRDAAVHADKFDDFMEDVRQTAKRLASSLSCALTLQKTEKEDGKGEGKVEVEEKEYDDSLWAFVPKLDSNMDKDWNHQESPTIFFRPMLDLMFRNSTTAAEQTHILAFSLVVICHELAHLMPRFVCLLFLFPTQFCDSNNGLFQLYGKDFVISCRHVGSQAVEGDGEGGEGVEELITGGAGFSINYKIGLF